MARCKASGASNFFAKGREDRARLQRTIIVTHDKSRGGKDEEEERERREIVMTNANVYRRSAFRSSIHPTINPVHRSDTGAGGRQLIARRVSPPPPPPPLLAGAISRP